MLTAKVIYDKDKPVFHMYLLRERRNTLISTLPPQLLRKFFQRELFHLQNALVINHFSADRLMEAFAGEILNRQEMHPYFYPAYFPIHQINTDLAEQIIELQDSFAFFSGMCLTQAQSPVEFYYLCQRFLMYQTYIFRTGKQITVEVLKSKYLIDSVALNCFNASANETDVFLEMDDEDCDYVIVVGQNRALKMLVSI